MFVVACVWKSENNLRESVVIVPKDKTQVVIPDSWLLYPSHPPLNLSVSMTDFSVSSTKYNEPLGKLNRWL